MNNKKLDNDQIDNLLYNFFETYNNTTPQGFTNAIKSAPHKNIEKNSKSKSILHYKFTKIAAVFVLFFTITTTGIVSANKLTDFLSNFFNLNSINLNNSSILDSIDNNEYIQNITDKKIKLNDEVSFNVDYLILDSSNIYLLFNANSNSISMDNYRINILDLKLSNNNEEFYNSLLNYSNANDYYLPGWKNINSNSSNTKELFFLYSNKIPKVDILTLDFSQVVLYNESTHDSIIINGNYKINIPVNDNLKEQEIVKHDLNIPELQDFYTSNTGTYCILKTNNINEDFILTVNNKKLESTKTFIFNDIDTNTYYYLLNYNFKLTDLKSNKLKSLTLVDTENNNKYEIKK